MSNCLKIAYANRWGAVQAMRGAARHYAARGLSGPAGVYLCSPCRGWHLTSKIGVQVPPWAKSRARR